MSMRLRPVKCHVDFGKPFGMLGVIVTGKQALVIAHLRWALAVWVLRLYRLLIYQT